MTEGEPKRKRAPRRADTAAPTQPVPTKEDAPAVTPTAFLDWVAKPGAEEMEPPRSPEMGDQTPGWVVWFYLTAPRAEFVERYRCRPRAHVLEDEQVRRFIGQRRNCLVTDGGALEMSDEELEVIFRVFGQPKGGDA